MEVCLKADSSPEMIYQRTGCDLPIDWLYAISTDGHVLGRQETICASDTVEVTIR
jgi:hypothetical protein